MASLTNSFSLLLVFFALTNSVSGMMLTIVNNCKYPIWPAILPNTGNPVLESGGFFLASLSHHSFPAPDQPWSGRVWARTGCVGQGDSLTCQTGDCGGKLQCNGVGGKIPTTLAQFSLHHGGDKDFSSYSVSLVDGFNIPLTITPHEGQGQCPVVGCKADLITTCPSELQLRAQGNDGQVIACKSACDAINTDEFCCRGEYNSPTTCKASSYSSFYKQSCPSSLTYAHDSPSLMQECSAAQELKVIFCH